MVRTLLRKYGGMFQLLWRQDSSLWIFIMVGNTETRPTRSLYYVAAVLMVETRWCSLLEAVSVLLSDSENLYWCWHTEGWGRPDLLTLELFIICILYLGFVEILFLRCSSEYFKSPFLSDLGTSLLYLWNIVSTRSIVAILWPVSEVWKDFCFSMY